MSLRWSSWCAQTGVFDETWRRHRVLRRRGTNQKSGRMYTDEAGQRWATSEATWKPCFLFSRAEVCALARSLLDGGPERAELREVSRLFTQRVEKCWRERRGLEPVVLSTRRSATLSHRHSKARPGQWLLLRTFSFRLRETSQTINTQQNMYIQRGSASILSSNTLTMIRPKDRPDPCTSQAELPEKTTLHCDR